MCCKKYVDNTSKVSQLTFIEHLQEEYKVWAVIDSASFFPHFKVPFKTNAKSIDSALSSYVS
jgi:hypothetical protein